MMASEDEIRRERARARLAARRGKIAPEAMLDESSPRAMPSESSPERTLIKHRNHPSDARTESRRDISQADLDKVNARRQGSRQRAQRQNATREGVAPGSKLAGDVGVTRGSRTRGGKLAGDVGVTRGSRTRGSKLAQGNSRARGRKAAQGPALSRGAYLPESKNHLGRSGALGGLLPKVLAGLLVIALAAGVVFLGRGCVAKISEYRAKLAAQNVEPADPETLPKFFEVSAIVGDSLAFQLLEKAVIDPDAAWIAANVDEYEQFGAADQRKLIRLAAMDSNAIEFVRGYPESFPAESGASGLPAWEGEGVPLYFQYDVRWGFSEYGGQGMGLTGCAPTCLAMVYQHVTGNDDKSPYDMAVHARNGGYVTEDIGTYTALFLDGVSSLGLTPHDLPRSAESVTWTLQNNGVIVANMREGDFTEGGHYIVLAGMDADGRVVVNDPFSSVNSAKTWDIDTVVSQSVRMIAYYKG